jgi:hypothetical protein
MAYMLYQQIAFGDALAFAKTQKSWRMREGSPALFAAGFVVI